MASSSGRMMRCARSLLASRMPSGRPISTQKASEVSTSDSVTIASGQMPSMATTSSDTTVPTASTRPANCQASRPMRAIMASVGRLVSRPSTQRRVPSMGARTVWKKGRRCSTAQPRPWLIQASTGRVPSQSWRRCRPPAAADGSAPAAASCGSESQLLASLASVAAAQGSAMGSATGVLVAVAAAWAAWVALATSGVAVSAWAIRVAGVCSRLVSWCFMRGSFRSWRWRQRPWWRGRRRHRPVAGWAARAACRGPGSAAAWSC